MIDHCFLSDDHTTQKTGEDLLFVFQIERSTPIKLSLPSRLPRNETRGNARQARPSSTVKEQSITRFISISSGWRSKFHFCGSAGI